MQVGGGLSGRRDLEGRKEIRVYNKEGIMIKVHYLCMNCERINTKRKTTWQRILKKKSFS